MLRGTSPQSRKAGIFGKKKKALQQRVKEATTGGGGIPPSGPIGGGIPPDAPTREMKIMERVKKATDSPNFRMGAATPIGSHKSGGILYNDKKVRFTNRSSHKDAVGTHKSGLPIIRIKKKKK